MAPKKTISINVVRVNGKWMYEVELASNVLTSKFFDEQADAVKDLSGLLTGIAVCLPRGLGPDENAGM